MTAEDRVAAALQNLPGQHIMSSSFGAQSAVMLHLVTEQRPNIPVVLIDTGYLFPETYRFIDELQNGWHSILRFTAHRHPARGRRLGTASAGIRTCMVWKLITWTTRLSRCSERLRN